MAASPQTELFQEGPPHLSHSSLPPESVYLAGCVGVPRETSIRNWVSGNAAGTRTAIFLSYLAKCQLLAHISPCSLNNDIICSP